MDEASASEEDYVKHSKPRFYKFREVRRITCIAYYVLSYQIRFCFYKIFD